MNKDVIYIDPEDDITDIINRLKSAKQKVVALVPPKKPGILRSAVNNKLITKTARQSEKVVVMVTSDPALTKIAIAAGIPVAKTLQSRPMMPSDAPASITKNEEEIIEEPEEEPTLPKKEDMPLPKEDSEIELNSSDIEEKDEKKDKKNTKDEKPIPKFEKYRKWIIVGSIAGVALIVFLVWALAIAPAAKVIVSIKTTSENFAEDVSFVTNPATASPDKGVFKLEKEEYKGEESVDFTATGEKDVGEKASGSLAVAYYFGTDEKGYVIRMPDGTAFSYNGMNYYAISALTLSWDGDDSKCEAGSSISNGCKISGTINIQAANSGANYNLDASRTDWASNASPNLHIVNPSAISGGTSKVIKVVQASDVAAARTKLEEKSSSGGTDLKSKLIKQFSDDIYVIDNSYSTVISDPVSTPAIGEEAPSGTGKLTTSTTATIYGVEKAKMSEYIEKITSEKLADDQKLYDIGSPFFEKFTGSNDSFTAKLKTTTHSGPKVTEQEILEKSKGKKIGEVQSLLRSINGVSNAVVEKTVFWMGSIPDDENKITVEMTVEDK